MRKLLFICIIGVVSSILSVSAAQMTRQEFRKALATPQAADVCRQALSSSTDAGIRRTALATLYSLTGEKACPFAEKAMADSDGSVREVAILILGAHLTPARRVLLEKCAQSDPVQMNQYKARHAIWPFYRKNLLLKNDKSWDYLVKEKSRFRLPEKGWLFANDHRQEGHIQKWHEGGLKAAPWKEQSKWSNNALGAGTVRWYRMQFKADAPAGKTNAFELLVKAGGMWDVWLNGIYLGNSTANPEDGSFRLDASNEVRKNAENVLVLRGAGAQQSAVFSGIVDCIWEE